MNTKDFDYNLPAELIAQTPTEPRDHSRLMTLSRTDNSTHHSNFFELPNYLEQGDVLVFNDSRVFPARLKGVRTKTGGKIELLLLNQLSPGLWRALARPGRSMREGASFKVANREYSLSGEVTQVNTDGTRVVKLSDDRLLKILGVMPLPPYIRQPLNDLERYQTVYTRVAGSVAAPTAGLHFTLDLMERLRSIGVKLTFVTLHVGWDSFRPIKTNDLESHKMHSEYYELNQAAAETINLAKNENRRVVCVGTTTVRLLEQAAIRSAVPSNNNELANELLKAGSGWANIFIYPGYRFQVADGLITNFHLPRSTLLMLTSAFAGRDFVLEAYRTAIKEQYRFYSLGDAMLIL